MKTLRNEDILNDYPQQIGEFTKQDIIKIMDLARQDERTLIASEQGALSEEKIEILKKFVKDMKTTQTLIAGESIETIHIPSLEHKIDELICSLATTPEGEKWISVKERLPVEINSEGKRVSKWVMVTNGKSREIAIYYPSNFQTCDWDDLDEDDLPHDIEKLKDEYWLKEGWWTEMENRNSDIMQNMLSGITHWQPLPSPPETKSKQ